MLDIIKNATNSRLARFFLAILLLCFILLWGMPQPNIKRERDLITSGKSTTTIDDYYLTLVDQSSRLALAYRLGRLFTPDEMQQYQIPTFVFNQLQQDTLLNEQARKMKISLSKDAIARAISADNMFQENGIFNKALFFGYLQQLRINENNFLDYYVQKEKRNQILSASLTGIKAPDTFHKALALYQGESRIADFFIIDLKEKVAAPTQEILQEWFETHKNEFRTPEYRTVSLLSMKLADFIKPADISVDEAKAYYAQNSSRFITPEKRIIEELRFPTREAADNAAQKIAEGVNFEDLVKAEKKTLDDIKKGPFAKNELPNYLASEVFELKHGQVSAVINDLQGPVIIRIAHITPSNPIPFKDAEQDIRQILAQNRAADYVRKSYTEIENARFEGASLKELSKQYELSLRTVTLDKAGKIIGGTDITDLPQKDILLNAIYQANEGSDFDPLPLQGGGYLWYRIDEIIPARNQTLEETEQAAVSQWTDEEIQRLLDKKAEDIFKQLSEGKSFISLIHELGVTQQTTPALRRRDSFKTFGTAGVKALFSGPKNHYGIIKTPMAKNRIIYQIKEVIAPGDTSADIPSADTRESINMMVKEDVMMEMLKAANKEHPLTINGANYNQIFNALQ
ncbi:peptidyl-prolyl cis-trans isomerase [Bartonella sp. CB178]|uniref:peptidyl-prolyl cis-trans isomerase n=1 Tax=Bartonella sp. CB178 TaxID=3112255 RepID=UPI00300DC49F